MTLVVHLVRFPGCSQEIHIIWPEWAEIFTLCSFLQAEVLNFILVRWLDNNLAERVARGRILKSALIDCRVQRTFVNII